MSGCDCPSRGESPHSMDCAMTAPARPAGDSGECPRCKGKGWTSAEDPRPGNTCDDCNGTGVVEPLEKLAAMTAADDRARGMLKPPSRPLTHADDATAALDAPEPAALPAQDELRSALIAALRLWLYPEDGEGGHLYRERIATQQAERATAALLAGPLAGLVAERDALRAAVARVEALADEGLGPAAWAYSDQIRDALTEPGAQTDGEAGR